MTSKEKYSWYLGHIIDKTVEYRKEQNLLSSSAKKSVEGELAKIVGKKEDMIRIYKNPNQLAVLKDKVDEVVRFAVAEARLSRTNTEEFLKLAVDLDCFSGNVNNLLEELFPEEFFAVNDANSNTAETFYAGIHNNLSAPTYSKYVMRSEFRQVKELLSESRRPIILIKSMGGNGKTSLAREIAFRCMVQEFGFPQFKAIIWITDKNKNGETNLNIIIDEIARVLGYNISSQTLESKKGNIDRILRQKSILLIIDNYETITDLSILNWLADTFPEKNKCIITSREKLIESQGKIDTVIMKGLNRDEARILIQNKCETLEYPIENIQDFDVLIDKFEGNPKAILMAIGLCDEGQPLKNCIEELVRDKSDLFQDLFARAWLSLDDKSRDILKLMSLFPNGTTKSSIIKILQLSELEFKGAMSKLNRLSLISCDRNSKLSESYYFIDSLVNAFASAKFEEADDKESTEQCWMDYYTNIAEKVKYCRDESNTEDLSVLDVKGLKEGFIYAIGRAHNNGKHDFVINVSKNIKYYYYIRGLWTSPINMLRASSAEKTLDFIEEFDAYVYHFNILCKQGNKKEIKEIKAKLEDLFDRYKSELPELSLIKYHHARALYYYLLEDYDPAISLWEDNLKNVHITPSQLNVNERWLGIAYFKKKKYDKAQGLLFPYVERLNEPNCKAMHSSLSAAIYLYKIYLENGNCANLFDKIEFALIKSNETRDHLCAAEFEHLMAKYHRKIGKEDIALKYYNDSIGSFEKMGCFEKVELIRKEL